MEQQILTGQRPPEIGEDSPPEEIVAWTLERFAHQRMVITTSFGMEGCALIDMYAAHGKPLTVIYLDTMFFFEETYRLRDRVADRYPHLHFVNCGTTLTAEEQERKYGPELWKTDADLCCRLRKVDPLLHALADVDVWIAGLRRSQSTSRAHIRVVDWNWQYQLLKISPLANLERQQIWEYVQAHDVPYNELHERGYPSIGCTHCTQPVEGYRIGQYTRAGRWNGQAKTECGMHGYGI